MNIINGTTDLLVFLCILLISVIWAVTFAVIVTKCHMNALKKLEGYEAEWEWWYFILPLTKYYWHPKYGLKRRMSRKQKRTEIERLKIENHRLKRELRQLSELTKSLLNM